MARRAGRLAGALALACLAGCSLEPVRFAAPDPADVPGDGPTDDLAGDLADAGDLGAEPPEDTVASGDDGAESGRDTGDAADGDAADARTDAPGGCDGACGDGPVGDLGPCVDRDGDGYGEGAACLGRDCNDGDPAVHPGAPERCNLRDDDCNGVADDLPVLRCGMFGCERVVPACTGGVPSTCTPRNPSPELCGNGIDEDCDGVDPPCCVRPVNSTCATATSFVPGETLAGDTVCAINDHASACDGSPTDGNDVAYRFASTGAPVAYSFRMSPTPGPGAVFDPVLHVHGSADCSASDQLACGNDVSAMSRDALVTLNDLPVGEYFVVVDTLSGTDYGRWTLTTSVSPLGADACPGVPIAANGRYTGSTATQTSQYDPPAACAAGAGPSPDVVYALTARTTGTITASLLGSEFDTVLYVSATCGLADLGCNDNFTGTGSRLSWSATAGTTYYLVVDGLASGNRGTYSLTITGY